MEEFVHFLMETGWLETMEADLASMDHEKLGRPFAFTDRAIQWANRLRIVFKTSYRLARGLMNHFLRGLGFQGISLTQFYDRCRRASAVGGADGRVLVSGPCDVDVSDVTEQVRRLEMLPLESEIGYRVDKAPCRSGYGYQQDTCLCGNG